MVDSLCYSGPHDGEDVWRIFRQSAERFFTEIGLSLDSAFSDCSFLEKLAERNITFLYEIAHGGYENFLCSINKLFTVRDAERLFANRGRIGFAFLANCWSHVKTGKGSISYAVRKGYLENTVTVGYYKAEEHPEGWRVSLSWQNRFFEYLKQDFNFGEAFDEAVADYPEIKPMIRMAGNRTLSLAQAKIVREFEPEAGQVGCLLAPTRIVWR